MTGRTSADTAQAAATTAPHERRVRGKDLARPEPRLRATPRQVHFPSTNCGRVTSGWEAQADQLALRTLRGEAVPLRGLTRAPAASILSPGSSGQPLPADLRADLEAMFHADLGAVRVHVDAQADTAVRGHHAEAITAANHVYFRQGRFDPTSAAGLFLLAHELAHVLQQTASRSHDGTLRANATSGSGEVQARMSPLDDSGVEPVPDVAEIIRRHRAAAPRDGRLDQEAKAVEKRMKDPAELEAYWTKLEETVLMLPVETDPGVVGANSLRYDLLKRAERWAGVRELLLQYPAIPTCYYDPRVYEKLPERPAAGAPSSAATTSASPAERSLAPEAWANFIQGAWSTEPAFAEIEPRRWAEVLFVFLLLPTRAVPNLHPKGGFPKQIDDLLARRTTASGLIPNELVFITAFALRQADALRVKKLLQFADESYKVPAGERELTKRGLVALKVLNWLKELEAGEGGLETEVREVDDLFKAAIPGMRVVAEAAASFWRKVRDLEMARAAGAVIDDLNPFELLRAFGRRKETIAFMRAIAPDAKKLLALEQDPGTEALNVHPINTLPAPDDYRANLAKLSGTMRLESHKAFELTFMREALKRREAPKASDRPNDALLLALGWMEAHVDLFLERFEELAKAEERDELVHHRLEVARWLGKIGDTFGFQELVRYSSAVTSASLEGQTLTMLALLDEWQETPSPISRLTEDFNADRQIPGFGGLTLGALKDFYQFVYFSDFASQIETMLRDEQRRLAAGGNFERSDTTLITDARNAVDESKLPMRYAVSGVDYAINPYDLRDWGTIIESHPDTARAFEIELAQDWLRVYPTDPPRVLVWFLPGPDDLINRLRKVVVLNHLLAERKLAKAHAELLAAGSKQGKEEILVMIPDVGATDHPAYLEVVALSNLEWWRLLVTSYLGLKDRGEAIFRSALSAVTTGLARDELAARDRLVKAMTAASIHERIQRVTHQLAPTLEKWNTYDQLSRVDTPLGNVLVFEIPDLVAKHLNAMIGAMAPVEDQPAHVTAATLALALIIDDELIKRPRADIIAVFKPLAEQAIAHVKKDRAAVRAVLRGTEATDTWIDERLGRLGHAVGEFVEAEAEVQEKLGIEAFREGNEQFITGTGRAHTFKPGESFVIDAVKWSIIEVKRTFVYHPKHGTTESKLLVRGKEGLEEVTGEARATMRLVTVKLGDGPFRTLKGDDDDLLSTLSNAITMAAIVTQLAELAQLIQDFTELLVEGAEFIPGAGQVVMASRLAISIVAFIASPEFDQLVNDVFRDPKAAFDHIVALIKLFDPSSLWLFLLFGNNKFDQLRNTKDAGPKAKSKAKSSTSGQSPVAKLARVLGRLYGVGLGLFGSTARLQKQVRWRAEDLQLFVLGHPLLARVLRVVADNVEFAAATAEQTINLAANWDKIVEGMTQQFIDAVNAFRTFELPTEIIPNAEIVEIIVQLVVSRLGKKWKAAAWIILELLELAGKKQDVFEAIASAIKRLGVADLNDIWKTFRGDLVSKLDVARDEFLSSMFDTLAQFPFFTKVLDTLRRGKTAGTAIPVSVADVPPEVFDVEATPALRPGALPRDGMSVALPSDVGRPLAAQSRAGAERLLGSDLAHVRIHRGAATTRMLSGLGAEALTAGSHIYLPSTTPSGPHGRRLVHHELTHVVQQTGRRSARQSTPPMGLGALARLSVDRARESEAERAANGSGGSGITRSPIAAQATFPSELIRRILDRVTGTDDVERDAAQDAKSGTKVDIDQEIRTRLKGYPDNLLKELHGTKLTFPNKPFDKGKTELTRHFSNQKESNHKAIRNSWDDVVRDALKLGHKLAKGAAGTKGRVKERVWLLDIERLGDAVSRLLLAETGVLIDVKFSETDAKSAVTLAALKVLYVHLPDVHRNSGVWTSAVADLSLGTGTEASKKLQRIEDYLRGRGVSSDVWKHSEFRLESDILERAEKWVTERQTTGGELLPANLPSSRDYLQLKKTTDPKIGLRLGKYKDEHHKNVPDRDSHHITQYLLLEYFMNKSKGNQPFRLLDAANRTIYPGLQTTSDGSPIKFGASKPIELTKLEADRGAEMPTILIARSTHRFGRLHIRKEEGDELPVNRAQSDMVDGQFRLFLPPGFKDGTVAEFEKYKGDKPPGMVEHQIRIAMLKTYGWMRERMQGRLGPALQNLEAAYYNTRAPLSPHKNDHLTDRDMLDVSSRAKEHNDAVMAGFGWKVE
jgi:hypothetical protein